MPILRPIFSVIFFTILAWFLSREIFQNIFIVSTRADFGGYQIFGKFNNSLILTSAGASGQFIMLLKQSFFIGLFLTFPLIFWEAYRFAKPKISLKGSLNYVFKTSLLFYLGAFLGYYIVLPMIISFLGSFSLDSTIQNEFSVDGYLMLTFGIVFTIGFIFISPIIFNFIVAIRKKSIISSSDSTVDDNQNTDIEEQFQDNPSIFSPILSILGFIRGVMYLSQDKLIAGIIAIIFGCVWGYIALKDRDLI